MAENKSFPILGALLNKSGDWHLDNRGSAPPLDLHIHFGWGAGVTKPAVLVWQNDEAMVLQTGFPLGQGEHVRVDRPQESGMETLWGEVLASRPGQRAGDLANGIQVHWLRMR